MIKAVIFDFDDTLVETYRPKVLHHQHVAKTYLGQILSKDEITRIWGKPLHIMVAELYDHDNIDDIMHWLGETHTLFPKVAYPESMPLVTTLKKIGIKRGIVTSTSNASLSRESDSIGIPLGMFDHIQAAGDTSFHKPDPRVFDPTIEWLNSQGIKPEETIYTGDAITDFEAATGAGFQFIGVLTGLTTAEQFQAAGANHLKNLSDFLEFTKLS